MVGEPGRGVPTIIEMVGHTRLDCVIGTAAGMRWAVANATHHAAGRSAFGRTLIDQPLMRNVLADLAIESEAATVLAMRLARAYDEAERDESAQLLKRLATAIGKYWVCKRAPGHAFEALECLGGNGYVEASGMPRLYREAPLASIWEGSGNVMSLDVLRALSRSPASADALFAELDEAAGADARLDAFVADLRDELGDPAEPGDPARGAWSSAWAWRCRARCWSATPRPRWPTRSAPRAWRATPGWPTARCRPARTSTRSSSATGQNWSAPGSAGPIRPPDHMPPRPFQLARVFGIRIGVNTSWFFVLFFFIWFLSGNFHDELGGSDTTAYAVAVAGALGFFASLILHELGHAIVARRKGSRSPASTCGSSAAWRA